MALLPLTWTFRLDGTQFTEFLNQLRTAYQRLAGAVNEQAQSYTFGTLPASPVVGQRAVITNSNTATFMANAAAGGGNIVPVFGDGTHWRVGQPSNRPQLGANSKQPSRLLSESNTRRRECHRSVAEFAQI